MNLEESLKLMSGCKPVNRLLRWPDSESHVSCDRAAFLQQTRSGQAAQVSAGAYVSSFYAPFSCKEDLAKLQKRLQVPMLALIMHPRLAGMRWPSYALRPFPKRRHPASFQGR